MKIDKHKTKVKFLVSTHSGQEDVFAFFPEERCSQEIGIYTSYFHIGQHSACHIDYANESIPATPEQYADLEKELKGLGYNLEIITPDLFQHPELLPKKKGGFIMKRFLNGLIERYRVLLESWGVQSYWAGALLGLVLGNMLIALSLLLLKWLQLPPF